MPFTEAIPGPAFAHKWLEIMNLPFESFGYGAPNQPPLLAGGLVLLPAICYDDAYGAPTCTCCPRPMHL